MKLRLNSFRLWKKYAKKLKDTAKLPGDVLVTWHFLIKNSK